MTSVILSVLLVLTMGIGIFLYTSWKSLHQKHKSLEGEHVGLKRNLESNLHFAKQIASGDYSVINAIGVDDELGRSLVDMSTNLKSAEIEDKKRNWSMAGLTKLAEIIRVSNHDLEELSSNLIVFLVKYLSANQGGLFVINESNPEHHYLELKACYAYERKKYVDKKIEIGEGLLGQVVLENDTIYLTDIPQEYIKITSGLGTSNPNALIVVPLKTEERVVGAIEIASFKPFETHEREFLEKASESIASSILTSRINEHTSRLLKESQDLTEQLRQQEEEVRQNMEEMQATTDEMVRKEKEIHRLLSESKAKEKLLQEKMEENERLQEQNRSQTEMMLKEIEQNRKIVIEVMNKLPQKIFLKDQNGRFLLLNEAVAGDLNKTIDELIGKNDFDLFPKEDAERFWQAEKDQVLDKRLTISNYEDFEVDGVRKYFYTVKMPFKLTESGTYGILGYQSEITEIKTLENKIKSAEKEMQDALDQKQAMIEALQSKLNK
ncbi:MAG TPA: GAF domain-containing protein [Cytophagales bacterium]|nr:GAF domain-containing protein [Cytophagales bacterium]